MQPCISTAENLSLSRIPDAKEIKDVVWEMNAMKAQGPDGLPGIFFKKYWQIVGPQVIIATQSFFREGWLLKQLNHTFITLIPKGMEHAISINFALLVSATSTTR